MSDGTQSRSLRPGQLAQLAGVSTDTLRHYERKGLLTPGRSSNGYREYPAQALARVRLVQQALSVGFRLDELARVLRIRDEGGAPCREVRALAATRLESLEVQLRTLSLLRDELRTLVQDWDEQLAQTPKGQRAHLLDHWSAKTPKRGPQARPSPSWNRHVRRSKKR
jgi:DNA-binding transcriptional MerR regulator